MACTLGYSGLKPKSVIFPDTKSDLEIMIDNLNLRDNIVALTAPTWVHYTFWDKGITTVEFVQFSKLRQDPEYYGKHIVKGIWVFKPLGIGQVDASFINCGLEVEEQLKYSDGQRR
jgi:hypothetical protein